VFQSIKYFNFIGVVTIDLELLAFSEFPFGG